MTSEQVDLERIEDITIQQLVYGGEGLARLPDGRVVFVPFSAPQDHVTLGLDPAVKKPLRGHIQEVVQPSPERITPACSVFGTCGGCQWQHLSLSAQQHWKQAIVEESLRRMGKLENFTVQPIIGAGDGWRYRNKVQWHVCDTEDGVQLGYRPEKAHTVVPFEECWIIPAAWNGLAHTLARLMPLGTGVKEVQVQENSQGQWMLSFWGASLEPKAFQPWLTQLIDAFPALTGVTLVNYRQAPQVVWGDAYLVETLRGKTYQISPDSFFQVNRTVTEQLLSKIEALLPETISQCLDLYAGVGLFSIALASRTQRMVAVESSSAALADLEANRTQNQCENLEILPGDVRHLLQQDLKETFPVVLVDPPRAGCHPDVLAWLSEHVGEQLLYISCDPTTLARDLQRLTASGFRLESIQPFDMFPQTYHVETLVSLSRA
jgi:23S rRNA (uracil1939-C5)-methyltransferase